MEENEIEESNQKSKTYLTDVNNFHQENKKTFSNENNIYQNKKKLIPPKKNNPKRQQSNHTLEKIKQSNTNDDNLNENKQKSLNKLYLKILFPEPYDGYYKKVEELYDGITPGIKFIKRLFNHDHAEKAINNLDLNMPETYWNDSEMFYIYNDPITLKLKMIKNDKNFKLYETILDVEENQYKRKLKPNDPFIVIRNNDFVKVERFEKAQDNLGKDIGDGLVQRYIRCRGKNRQLLKELIMKSKPQTQKAKFLSKNDDKIINKDEAKLDKDEKLKKIANKKSENLSPNVNEDKVFSQDENEENYEKNEDLSEGLDGGENENKKDGNEYELDDKGKKGKNKKGKTKPSVVRLEYKTGYNSDKGCNVAYCLSNKEFTELSLDPETNKKKLTAKEILETYYDKLTTLNVEEDDSFSIYVMSGLSVAPYEYYANQIVTYLQKWYKILLKTIVLDFMTDERGIIYFLGCKYLSLVKDPSIIPKGLNYKLPSIKDEENIKKFYKTWTCSLCMLPYPKAKITKIVTFKLLYKLKQNLNKRGCNYFDHIKNNDFNESQSCRVCDLCYTLLVTEQELMEIQKTIALCTNIEVPNDELLNNESKKPEKLQSASSCNSLVQWRIMFYFLKFYFFDYSKLIFEDGSQLPPNSTPNEKKKAKTNYKLYITLFDQKIKIPIFTEMKQFISKDEIELNCSKIFYFFSNKENSENSSGNNNVKQILRSEVVDFRIVLNDKFNDPIAECKTTLFSCYDDNVEEKPITSKMVLNFFSNHNNIKHFKCQMYIGLKNDGEVQTGNLQLYGYKYPKPIYLTDLDYYSYHPLPSDWYELFKPPDSDKDDDDKNRNKDKESEDENMKIDELIDNIIIQLEGKEKKKKSKNIEDDEVYDPYDLLVKIQNKNDIINKIESLPIVLDKEFIEMKQEEKKERPKTSKLMEKYDFSKNSYKTKPKKAFNVKKKEEEKFSPHSKNNDFKEEDIDDEDVPFSNKNLYRCDLEDK